MGGKHPRAPVAVRLTSSNSCSTEPKKKTKLSDRSDTLNAYFYVVSMFKNEERKTCPNKSGPGMKSSFSTVQPGSSSSDDRLKIVLKRNLPQTLF